MSFFNSTNLDSLVCTFQSITHPYNPDITDNDEGSGDTIGYKTLATCGAILAAGYALCKASKWAWHKYQLSAILKTIDPKEPNAQLLIRCATSLYNTGLTSQFEKVLALKKADNFPAIADVIKTLEDANLLKQKHLTLLINNKEHIDGIANALKILQQDRLLTKKSLIQVINNAKESWHVANLFDILQRTGSLTMQNLNELLEEFPLNSANGPDLSRPTVVWNYYTIFKILKETHVLKERGTQGADTITPILRNISNPAIDAESLGLLKRNGFSGELYFRSVLTTQQDSIRLAKGFVLLKNADLIENEACVNALINCQGDPTILAEGFGILKNAKLLGNNVCVNAIIQQPYNSKFLAQSFEILKKHDLIENEACVNALINCQSNPTILAEGFGILKNAKLLDNTNLVDEIIKFPFLAKNYEKKTL